MRQAEKKSVYRIYTENKNRPQTVATVGEFFEGFTVFEAVGLWKGQQEKSLVFEIIADSTPQTVEGVEAISEAIKRHNQQEAVYITVGEISARLI